MDVLFTLTKIVAFTLAAICVIPAFLYFAWSFGEAIRTRDAQGITVNAIVLCTIALLTWMFFPHTPHH